MHIPVLQKEVIKYLAPKTNENFIDATVGEGNHSLEIIEKIKPKGRILGIDWDPEVVQNLKQKLKRMGLEERFIVVCSNFAELKKIADRYNFQADGILFDLGFLTWHIEESKRGFSFQKDENLDMRYNPKENPLTAQEIVNKFPFQKIVEILRKYGEERFARRIARKIEQERRKHPITTTTQLVEIVRKATPPWYHHRRIHFATRTFLALRIAVNDEIENLRKALIQVPEVLSLGGRLVVISFHSLEDRVVKEFLKDQSKKGIFEILTKKPQTPTPEEVKMNPRCRSAKLRAAKKIK
ncbi:16S rRNA (cytosine(1402)-N(4))-methyltransferase RsmH [bacterium]|nr:16S rRNA (cytosine(1402)-N(4))-methyltransferase RsmH [bacterium]